MAEKAVVDREFTNSKQKQGDAQEEQFQPPSVHAPPPFAVPKAVSSQPVPEGAALDHPALYFNRELSWVDFNWRVLHLAMDNRTPLLERVRFVAITASNLDEFIQKRVGGLKRQEGAGVRKLSPDGRTPTEQLELLHRAISVMQESMVEVWEKTLKPALKEQANIVICDYADLDETEQAYLRRYFQREIYPILTPLAVDAGHPFPFISNLSLSLAIILRHPQRQTTHFARLKVPTNLQRWLPVNPDSDSSGPLRFLPIEQLIISHISDLFVGMDIVSVHPFRITRNADIERDEEVATDLLSMISEELRERRFASVVRLEVASEMPEYDRSLLMRELDLEPEDVYKVEGLLDLTGCNQLADLDFPKFKFKHWEPAVPGPFHPVEEEDDPSTFDVIRRGDLLVHHPYDSFTATVQRLVEEAAADEQVLALKQTLYRTSDESPIVKALTDAAEKGKQVAVLIEVKARFDEAKNIEWGRRLNNAGVHVAYGLVGLKTHTKATLIVRKDEDGLRTYCHIGTGNYHSKTARLYTDLGLLTCSPELGQDVVNLFHYLTGSAPSQEYRKSLVAPHNMRQTFNRLIDQEIDWHQEHKNGRIIAKMNALDDVRIIRKLYEASQAGVQVDLIIRGLSRLRPGLEGFSDNIRVVSILGRFLEHDRIYYFQNNDQPLIFIGSADWRNRNLEDRVELITPIEEPDLKKRLIRLLEEALSDNRLAWDLNAEGHYRLRRPEEGEPERNFHEILMQQALERSKKPLKKSIFQTVGTPF